MDGGKRAGVVYMVLGIASLSGMVAVGTRVAAQSPVFKMRAARSPVALVLILVVLGALRRLGALRTQQPAGHALRAFCGLVAFVCFYAALRHLPLADAVAIAFASPFLVTALGRFLLKEAVAPRQWLAIAVGFAGMLVIVRPCCSRFPPAALLAGVSCLASAGLLV